MVIRNTVALLLFGANAWSTALAFAQEASFTGIGFIPDGISSSAWAVSGNGSVIVGQATSPVIGGALRWENGQAELLEGFSHIGFGVSANGEVIVGYGNQGNGDEAYRWEDGVTNGLGDLPGGDFESYAWDVSSDGSVVVGWSEDAIGRQPFRWEDGVMEPLDHLPGNNGGNAYGVSADGRIIAGASGLAGGTGTAVRWIDGAVEPLPPPNFQPYDISDDGSVIVGARVTGGAYIWRAGAGTFEIPPPIDPNATILAHAVSGDGRLVFGTTSFGDFIWTEETGARLLKDVLQDLYGLDLTGWALGTVAYKSVNYDGTVIVGQGFNPKGDYEGWRAELPPWPVAGEPEVAEATISTVSIFPNPLRDRATVRTVLNIPSRARVTVSDVLGRTVAVLHDGPLAAGGTSLAFSAENLPPGVYVVRVELASGQSASRTVTVLR